MADFYGVLGVSRNANEKEIRQAYRKLARQHHPDVNGSGASDERFKSINEAYSILSDPDKRRRYDRYGDNWEHSERIEQEEARARQRGGFHWSGLDGSGRSHGDPTGHGFSFESLFSDIGGFSQARAVEHPVEITLEEAFAGATRVLSLQGGRRIEVKIPAGVDNGSRVHIPPRGTGQGDMYLVVSVKPHPKFQRKGKDLSAEVDVLLETAILGGDVNVDTLTGQVALTIPPETQNGQRFRLAGRGMPELQNSKSRGSLYATVKVVLPTGLTEPEKELFRQMKELREARDTASKSEPGAGKDQ